MDWTKRKYYLAKLDACKSNEYCTWVPYLKEKFPSIKYGKPYNHIKTNSCSYGYDGWVHEFSGTQMMISCPIEDAPKLEEEIRRIRRRARYVKLKEITREICGQ